VCNYVCTNLTSKLVGDRDAGALASIFGMTLACLVFICHKANPSIISLAVHRHASYFMDA
jgi:hypothetical protein